MGGDNKCRLNQNDNQIISNHRNHLNLNHHFDHHNHNHNTHRPSNELNGKLSTVMSTAATGQLALDRLLESLAIESDIMEQQLAQLNGNGRLETSPDREIISSQCDKDTIFTYPATRDNNYNTTTTMNAYANQNGVHSNLNDVIENLTEFTRHETMRQLSLMNGNGNGNGNGSHHSHQQTNILNNHANNYHLHNNHNNHHINNINGNRHYQEPSNAIKRLTSESENSSSISPSLSERSNGVSWSDQVRSIYPHHRGDSLF